MKTPAIVMSNISSYFAIDLMKSFAFNDRYNLKNTLWKYITNAILAIFTAFSYLKYTKVLFALSGSIIYSVVYIMQF